ncbi:MAG: glycosyl transferase [Desulfosoma sp.]|uniref:glycosyl transferase n=1 Tax=Desulfosoma sp. TaxID=2603217 RepID=UPI004048F0CE
MKPQSIHAFTSITCNYIPKARVLARSLKSVCPDVHMHLCLNDEPPSDFDLRREPFDNLIVLDSLDIPNKKGWIFGHSLVELCTAVKGLAFQKIFRETAADKVFYFDPDIVVFGRFDELAAHLERGSILLTPHLTDPEEDLGAVADNEIASLKHGVFNLGFLGIRRTGEGMRFLDWWSARLYHFCQDDIPGGLFTDQRWVDLAPCFFDEVVILRDPGFNVATWNLSHRHAEGSLKSGIFINGKPLGFYHFSGFDSGAQEIMLKKYAGDKRVLFELRQWYIEACKREGQELLGHRDSVYARYSNGEIISAHQRAVYRTRPDVQKAFPNPFSAEDINRSYYHWYKAHYGDGGTSSTPMGLDVPYRRALWEFASYTKKKIVSSPRLPGFCKPCLVKALEAALAVSRPFVR